MNITSTMRIFSKPQLWLTLALLVSQVSAATAREIATPPAPSQASATTVAGQFTEYPLNVPRSPRHITAGPDGALWFTDEFSFSIVRITTSGEMTEYLLPNPPFGPDNIPDAITVGPDGALWFTAFFDSKIGRLTTDGVMTLYPTPSQYADPNGITAGPDGALWFTESATNSIGRITTDGVITEFPIPLPDNPPIFYNSRPIGITAGPDGALWFTEYQNNTIGRITPEGVITEYPIPTPDAAPYGITAGPDGALWFTEVYGMKIGRITTAGIFTEYPILTPGGNPWWITAGPDGALWFTEYYENVHNIGRITTGGVITEYPLPNPENRPYGITAGPDGALWFTEQRGVNGEGIPQIGRFEPDLGLKVQVTADRTTVLATEMITATVIITNTSLEATSAVTLTLTEGEGMLYALRDEQDEGRFGTIEGRTNVVYFDALDFDPGEQKTFHIPLIISPLPNPGDESLPVSVTSNFSATNASGATVSADLTITANPLTDGPIDTSAFDSLPGQPVGDLGANPDDPFGVLAGTSAVLEPTTLSLSDGGDLWDIYLRDSKAKWTDWDKKIFNTLTKLGFSKRDAYAAVYVRAIILLRPSGSCVPSKGQMGKAITTWYIGLQRAKWWHHSDGFYSAFREAVKGLGSCSSLYPMNLLEFHSQYTTPMIDAMQSQWNSYTGKEIVVEQKIYDYIVDSTAIVNVPLPRLVEADVDYYLSRRQWHPILHNQVMAQVDIRANNGGTIKLGTAIYKVMTCDPLLGIAYGLCPEAYRKPWTALQVHSPLLPLVTDSQGRRSGLDAATGQLYDEIPGMVIEPGHPWVLLLPATTEQLQVQWTTAYPYQFGIDVQGIYSGTLTSQSSSAGFAAAGFTANQTITVTVGSSSVTVSASPVTAYTLFLPLIVR